MRERCYWFDQKRQQYVLYYQMSKSITGHFKRYKTLISDNIQSKLIKNLLQSDTFSLNEFLLMALPGTAVRFFTLTSNLHKVTSFFDVTAVKTNVT